MEDKKRRSAAELLKSALIVLLTVSALALVGKAQVDSGLPVPGDWLGNILNFIQNRSDSQDDSGDQAGLSSDLRPVRIAVCNGNGRYGVQYNAELTDAIFQEKLGALLGDALTGAGTPATVSEDSWRAALDVGQPSAYYDFLGSVPLSALSVWLGGGENNALTGEARRILLAPGSGDAVLLYYCGSDGSYYACSTDLSADTRLRADLSAYTPNQAVFAFEEQERYRNLEPYVLILPDTPKPWIYQVSNPIGPEMDDNTLDQLLKDLSFHPQTSSVYPAADGQGVREGTDTLRLGAGGTVTYHAASSQNPRYPVDSDQNFPNLGAMVEAARALVRSGLGPWCGAADLYLMKTEQQKDGSTVIYFGYQLDGAAVQLYEDGYAARVVVDRNYISEYTLRFRAYQKTDAYSAVLPELQAAAALKALGTEKNELLLRYQDDGGTQVTAGWTAQ